eukprot:5973-Heterococcus_DN1.PRE.4
MSAIVRFSSAVALSYVAHVATQAEHDGEAYKVRCVQLRVPRPLPASPASTASARACKAGKLQSPANGRFKSNGNSSEALWDMTEDTIGVHYGQYADMRQAAVVVGTTVGEGLGG